MPISRPRSIEINAALNGYIVRVGCQTVVFEDRKRMLENLDGYLTSPTSFEKTFRANAMHTSNDIEPCVQPEPRFRNVAESIGGGICSTRAEQQHAPSESLGQIAPQTDR